MVDTLLGITIEVRLVQLLKVPSFISDRFSLSVIDDNASQPLNAFLPISLILLGILGYRKREMLLLRLWWYYFLM